MLPIIDADIQATKLSLYNAEVHPKLPLLGLKLKNTSGKKLYGAVYIAFFDKDKNLVGCSSRTGIILDAGKQMFVGSVLDIPPEEMDRIASYQVKIYEADKEIGKK